MGIGLDRNEKTVLLFSAIAIGLFAYMGSKGIETKYVKGTVVKESYTENIFGIHEYGLKVIGDDGKTYELSINRGNKTLAALRDEVEEGSIISFQESIIPRDSFLQSLKIFNQKRFDRTGVGLLSTDEVKVL